MARTRQGKAYTWQVDNTPIGSGDAGEVYAARCIEQPELAGVLKAPARVATGGTIQRQAGQIAQERTALARLDGLPAGKAHPPRLLDEAPEFTHGTASYFIVSETAPGDDLASMLVQSRQSGKPFPRRVIITVLDALFDLFSRAHHAGVLWNDVKPDHIYWHNTSGSVTVIDWGNAIFLENQSEGMRYVQPRWEDYRQMIDTLGDFLQRNAPELFVDLGWEEFQNETLDLPKISVLARRIAYQQQVVSLMEMEYQSLIQVVLKHEPDLTGLQKITQYKDILEQIGAPWSETEVQNYARSLILTSLAGGDIQPAVQAAALAWDLFDDRLDLAWHLVREYFRHPDLLVFPALADLVKATFVEDYPAALWMLLTIAAEQGEPVWWHQLIPVLRQKALGSVVTPPRQAAQTLLSWAEDHRDQDKETLVKIITGWRDKGRNSSDNPLEYTLFPLFREKEDLPQKLRVSLRQSIAPGEEAIRNLLKSWSVLDWDALSKAFQMLAAWDPDRWGFVDLYEKVENLQGWLAKLYAGPDGQETAEFLVQQSLSEITPVERNLGTPPWLKGLKGMLQDLLAGGQTASYQTTIRQWCPWLLAYPAITSEHENRLLNDEKAANHVLAQFTGHLKTWTDPESELQTVKEQAPTWYNLCKRLADGFESVISLNFAGAHKPLQCEEISHETLLDACQVLEILHQWREQIDQNLIQDALETLQVLPHSDWKIVTIALEETSRWQTHTLPVLEAIQSFSLPLSEPLIEKDITTLLDVAHSLADLRAQWAALTASGLHLERLASLSELSQQAYTAFFAWRHQMEHTDNRLRMVLYHSSQEKVRAISDTLLNLYQHIRLAMIRFSAMESKSQLPFQTQSAEMESLLDHLTAIEDQLIHQPQERKFPDWQKAYEEILSAPTTQARQSLVVSLPENHPLSPWLVQSILENN